MSIFSRVFLLAALERSVKTACQSAVAMLLANGTGVLDTDWAGIGSVALMAGIISILTSIGSNAVGEGGPSLTTETTAPEVDTADVGRHYDRDGDGLADGP